MHVTGEQDVDCKREEESDDWQRDWDVVKLMPREFESPACQWMMMLVACCRDRPRDINWIISHTSGRALKKCF
jgi:hypothetical protein